MNNGDFTVFAFSAILGIMGLLAAVNPRALPRMTNAYYALIRMKSRLAEDDYDKIGVRVAGGLIFLFALYVFIDQALRLWK